VRSKQPEFQSERVMGEVCLGVAVAGVETLIAIAIAILLYRGPPQLAAPAFDYRYFSTSTTYLRITLANLSRWGARSAQAFDL
jgi:hypothetical protein